MMYIDYTEDYFIFFPAIIKHIESTMMPTEVSEHTEPTMLPTGVSEHTESTILSTDVKTVVTTKLNSVILSSNIGTGGQLKAAVVITSTVSVGIILIIVLVLWLKCGRKRRPDDGTEVCIDIKILSQRSLTTRQGNK